MSLALWLAASLGIGLILYFLTHNLWLACGAQWIALKASLFNIAYEPMHPGGLLCLLLVVLAATPLVLPDRPRLALVFQGATMAALSLVKINVGAFAFLALGVAIATTFPQANWPRLGRVVTLGAIALFVAAPSALLAANLGAPWAQRYDLHVTASALAVALALFCERGTEPVAVPWRRWFAGSAITAALVIVGLLLVRGTSLGGLVRGTLIEPLHHANAFTLPLELPPTAGTLALVALVALVVAATPWLDRWRGALRSVGGGMFRLAIGSALAVTASGVFLPKPLGFLAVPWAWVAVWRPYGLEDSKALGYFRRFVPPLAVLQTLHAYPVAGSQVQWGAYLLVLVAGICVVDGARQLASTVSPRIPAGSRVTWWLARAVALVVAVLVLRDVLVPLRRERLLLENTTRLLFPGSRRVHLPYHEAEQLAWVVRELRANCATFVSLPGLHSFHLWSGLEPPTSWNTTAWMFLFDEARQARIVEKIRPLPRLCLLRQERLAPLAAAVAARKLIARRLGPSRRSIDPPAPPFR